MEAGGSRQGVIGGRSWRITLGSGRTNVMQGTVHLVIFAAFVFLAFVP